jgi:hypothetical protein
MVGVMVAGVLGLAQPVRADGFGVAVGAVVGSAYIDSTVTAFCHGAGTCREVGPVLGPLAARTGIVTALAVKGVSTGAGVWGLVELRKDHPKAALWIAVGLAVGQGVVDAYNIRQLRRNGGLK